MRKKIKAAAKKPVRKFQSGGRVNDSDIPEERGPVGLRYNQLLSGLREMRQHELEAEQSMPSVDFERRRRNLERQNFNAPGSEALARQAAQNSTRRNAQVASAQGAQRLYESALDEEGRRIGQRRYANPAEMRDAGFKKGGKVSAKKGKK